MKITKHISFIILGLLMFSRLASADIGIGATGTLAMIDASGSETEGTAADTSDRSKSVDNNALYGSIFAEYIADNNFVIGVSYNPFSADVSDATHSRTDTSEAGSGEGRSGSNTQTADAEVENYASLYMEIPMASAYLKLGAAQIDVKTKENAITNGGTYGDATLDAYIVGVGLKGDTGGGYYYKLAAEYVDFEDLSLSSSTNNSITADLDITEINFSIGKKF